MKLENILKMTLLGAAVAVPKSDGQITVVPYEPDQTVVIAAPVTGISADSNNYFLAHGDDFSTLPLNFTSSSIESPQSWDLSNVIDSANSPYANSMFQLTAGGVLEMVDVNSGALLDINNQSGIFLGGTARGIGTDPSQPNIVGFSSLAR